MKSRENNPNRKTIKVFWTITSAILVALVIWFVILPVVFNAGSSILKNVFSKKEEVKFEAFSPEAFAYDIGDSWEVNATINVKGFKKIEIGEEYSTSLNYNVDIINPEGDTTKNIFSDTKEVKEKEIDDVQLEAQFELDYSSVKGKYKLIFNIADNNSGKSISSLVEFELKD